MSDDELELNTLSRFAKRSPGLVLEEHGHCEVPAGCGGVVLRWRNPQAGLTAVLQRAGSGRTMAFLDGEAPASSFLSLAFGEHVLAIHVSEIARDAAVFGLSAHRAEGRSGSSEPIPSLCTKPDGTWRYTTVGPVDDAWRELDFDDRKWAALGRGERPRESKAHEQWSYRLVEENGGLLLALPQGMPEVWIRKRLTIEPPEGGGR
jgi:hypothetical protein